MAVTWIELHPESRGWQLDRNGINKDFSFIITCDDNEFVEYATTDYLPGTSLVLYNDDGVVQNQILGTFKSALPTFFEFYIDETFSVILYLSSLRVTQLTWEMWRVDCTFDLPQDNGANQNGENTPDPNQELNSDQYTQISFNSVVVQEQRQRAIIKECSPRIDSLALETFNAAYWRDKSRLIGQTDDEILGYTCNVRSFSFSLTQYMSPTKLTYAYVRRLHRLVGSLNLYEFFGFAPWSVMCVGCDGSGTVYSAVPVKLDFEVRPNFRFENIFTLPEQRDILPPIEDTYSDPNVFGIRKVNTTSQFIRKFENEFKGNGDIPGGVIGIDQDPIFYPGLDVGVHSGWSQIEYSYVSKVVADETKIIKEPTRRYHYLPEEYIADDFSKFLL